MNKLFFFGMLAIITIFISCGSAKFQEIQTSLPDLKSKSDGLYRGNYDLAGTPVIVTLDVNVVNHKITGINIIKHSCSPIGKKAEKITAQIIEKQSLNIDSISGATASSKSILKAVENALQ
jgi:uncharacterized protein with FMN-binding domain